MELPMGKLVQIFTQTLIFLHLLSFTMHASASTLGNQTDKLVLLELKSQLIDDPFGLLASWNDSIPFCRWKGVTCGSKHQRVTSLDISGMNLPGTISPHIGNLSFLATLNLAENFFTGIVPPEFGRLVRLRYLNLSFNFIDGGIPVNISRCIKLVTLALNNNNMTYQIPPELGTLPNLVILYLNSNKIIGRIPKTFGNLSSIQELILTRNNLQGEIPDSIAQMRSLTRLGVAINNISGGFPPPFYNLSSLQFLSLTGTNLYGELRSDIGLLFPNIQTFWAGLNRFTGVIPASFSNASNLQQLSLASNNFISNIPIRFENLQALSNLNVGDNSLGSGAADDLNFLTHLANCSRLETLVFSSNHFGGELPSSIGNLTSKLTWLNGYGNNMRGNFPAEIASLVSLINLNMGSNLFTGTLPVSLGKLSNLVDLYLGGNHFTGEIPFSFRNLTRISTLDLHNNTFEGRIPSYFGSFKYLQVVLFCHNRLNGTIPKELVSVPSLFHLNLSHNSLTGSMPGEIGNLDILVDLDVSYNTLSGNIPNGIGNCLALEQLYVQGNSLEGTIPDLNRLRGLQFLDLSQNNFHGQIPTYMAKFSQLQNLNLSNNNLVGEIPTGGVFENASAIQIYGNNHLCGGVSELHLRPCPVQNRRKTKKHITNMLKLLIIIVSPCLVATLLLLLLIFTKKEKSKILSPTSFRLFRFYPEISYKELLRATDGFSSRNLIGSGSFGDVYEGSLGADGKTVAVKVLNLQHQGASKSFKAECQAVSNIRHRNLVRIITICSSIDFEGHNFRALVYEFMPSGSLERWLHPVEGQIQESLSLLQRICIAADVASALDYLHHQCRTPVVHCDLKPSNILLDGGMTAHVSDFGLARLVSKFGKEANSNQFSSLGFKGTIGYAAPEYGVGGKISTHGDVYSFGILLLEIFTGKRPTEEAFRDNCNLRNYVKLSLPDKVMDILDQSAVHTGEVREAKNEWRSDLTSEQIECIRSVLGIGVACSAENPRDRVSMELVCWQLLSIKEKFIGPRNTNDNRSWQETVMKRHGKISPTSHL